MMNYMRVFIPIGFLIIFILWILYRLIVKKDLKKNLSSLYAGLAFIMVWAAIYFWLLR